jgi:uncharacterized protein with GYD domain
MVSRGGGLKYHFPKSHRCNRESIKRWEVQMPIFVTQGRVRRGYIRGGMSKPEDRYAYVSGLCEQAGGRLLSFYFTLGHYDFLLVTEVRDAQSVSLLSLAATGGGRIESVVTTQAFTTAEMKDLYTKAGKIDYRPMGGAA